MKSLLSLVFGLLVSMSSSWAVAGYSSDCDLYINPGQEFISELTAGTVSDRKVVCLREGNHVVSSTLNLPNNFILRGEGLNDNVILRSSTNFRVTKNI